MKEIDFFTTPLLFKKYMIEIDLFSTKPNLMLTFNQYTVYNLRMDLLWKVFCNVSNNGKSVMQ